MRTVHCATKFQHMHVSIEHLSRYDMIAQPSQLKSEKKTQENHPALKVFPNQEAGEAINHQSLINTSFLSEVE